MNGLCEVLEVWPLTRAIHETGLAIIECHDLSTYDAMIVAAALDAGCNTLLSEDMQNGMVFQGRLRISNPFRA